MSEREAHELLKQARLALGLDHAAVAARTGVREAFLISMEAGRWEQLPHGLYARAAVRHYASFLRLDADAILRSCEASLPGLEDPIAGLARVRGLKPQKAEVLPARPREPEAATTRLVDARPLADFRRWPDRRRVSMLAAAMAIDSALIAAPLLLAVAAAALMNRVPPSAMDHGAGAFGAFGALMALLYFLCFAGVAGATVGERVTGTSRQTSTAHTLGAVRDRALAAAFRDLHSIGSLGVRIGRLTLRRVGANGAVDGERLAF